MPEDTSGYYKLDGATLLHAPNAVYMPKGVSLSRAAVSAVPVDGWGFFDSREAACAAYGYLDTAVTPEALAAQVDNLWATVAAKDQRIIALTKVIEAMKGGARG